MKYLKLTIEINRDTLKKTAKFFRGLILSLIILSSWAWSIDYIYKKGVKEGKKIQMEKQRRMYPRGRGIHLNNAYIKWVDSESYDEIDSIKKYIVDDLYPKCEWVDPDNGDYVD